MNFLDKIYLDNSLRSYLVVAVVILFAFILKRIISKYATTLIFRWMKPGAGILNKSKFDSYVVVPVERVLFVLIAIFAIDRLNFPKQLAFSIHTVTSREIVEGLSSAIIIICFVSLIIHFMDFVVHVIRVKEGGDKPASEFQLLFFFKDFIRVVIIIIGFAFILKISFGLDIGNLLTGLSIVGAALALAAKESLENLIASFIIFFDKPFGTGDVVKVNNYSGTVEKIGLRSTRIRTIDKSLVTVPNKQMVDSILDNWSMRNLARNEIKALLSPQSSSSDLEKAINGIEEILKAYKQKLDSFSVYLDSITVDSAIISVIYFTPISLSLDQLNQLKQDINLEIKRLQEKHDIKSSVSGTIKLVN
jgi:MscS family membrane protein